MTQAPGSPFDALARDYDSRFSERLPAAWLRGAVRQRIGDLLCPGLEVLELGCGTGDDSVWFADKGCRVHATDASARMLEVARRKAGARSAGARISFAPLDLCSENIPLPDAFEPQLVFSNFGAFNCVADPASVLRSLHALLAERGHVAVTLMGRFCLWETVYFACRGRLRQAVRRWGGKASYRVGDAWYPVWYHSAGHMRAAAKASGFDVLSVCGIGGLLPMSEAFHLCERWPRAFTAIARWDRRLAPWLVPISDHYLLVLGKKSA